MKKIFAICAMSTFLFAACGGDDSTSASVHDTMAIYDEKNNTVTDPRDNKTYKTVKIGDQVWMAENLNYAYLQPTEKRDSSSLCDNLKYCEKYGRLYLWSAAMDSAGVWSVNGKGCGNGKKCSPTYPVRGVCPKGWHLPTLGEWSSLFSAVGGKSTAGIKLKSSSEWDNDANGTDDFSFSALPAGYGDFYGIGHCEGEDAYFWSSTDNYEGVQRMHLSDGSGYYNADGGYLDHGKKDDWLSVRCVKDDE
ncbi:MAG: fibrobacter succinogenes major paralogous domain-containing protein [Fibrobacter sp.]|nr:fibrobacter succinogenes major paralogous domain-containing protein [Fibrobacter sp.]